VGKENKGYKLAQTIFSTFPANSPSIFAKIFSEIPIVYGSVSKNYICIRFELIYNSKTRRGGGEPAGVAVRGRLSPSIFHVKKNIISVF
jgi:hypothetical protein